MLRTVTSLGCGRLDWDVLPRVLIFQSNLSDAWRCGHLDLLSWRTIVQLLLTAWTAGQSSHVANLQFSLQSSPLQTKTGLVSISELWHEGP